VEGLVLFVIIYEENYGKRLAWTGTLDLDVHPNLFPESNPTFASGARLTFTSDIDTWFDERLAPLRSAPLQIRVQNLLAGPRLQFSVFQQNASRQKLSDGAQIVRDEMTVAPLRRMSFILSRQRF